MKIIYFGYKSLIVTILFGLSFNAYSAELASGALSTARLFGSWTFVIILVVGIIKVFSISRRATASSMCVNSLGFVLIGWLTSAAVPLIPGLGLVPKAFISFGAIFCLLIGTVIAVIGLLQYKNNQALTQGRSQAIWALVIGVTFLLIVGYYASEAYQERIGSSSSAGGIREKNYQNETLNFRFTSPSSKYIELDKDTVNEDATLLIRSTRPIVYFMIFAERLEPETFNLDSLEKLVLSNVKGGSQDFKLNSKTNYTLNGMDGILLDMDSLASSQKFNYLYWIYERNGFVYQLIAWSTQKNRAVLAEEFPSLIASFKMLSKDQVALPSNKILLEDIRSEYGISLNANGTNWASWNDIEDDYPLALFGGEIGSVGYFQVTPLCFDRFKLHQNAVRSALLQPFSININDENLLEKEDFNFGETVGKQFSYTWDNDDGFNSARYTFVEQKKCTFLISLWSSSDENEIDIYNNKLLKMLSFNEFNDAIKSKPPKNIASLLNDVGIYYYENKNYLQARKSFKAAVENDTSNAVYLNNVFDTFNKTLSYQEALEYFNDNSNNLTANNESQSWLAWFYQNTENTEQAKKKYSQAFESGYKNDQDLKNYVDLLLESNETSKAEKALNNFSDNANSVLIGIKRSQLKRKSGEYKAALSILDQVSKGKRPNPDIIFERIYINNDQGEYAKVISLAEKLISRGHESAGAHYQKGIAQYELNWYVQSKKSFEKALSFAPNNDNIKDYLKNVNGMLGEGDSASIAYKLEPVKHVANNITIEPGEMDASEFDSFYLEKNQSFFFKIGQKLRETTSQKIKVITNQGVKRFNTIEIDFDPLYERAFINKLEVSNSEGVILFKGDREKYFVLDSKDSEASTTKTIHLPIANLAPNNIIEYTYTTETLSKISEFPYTKIYHSSSRPVGLSSISIEGDVEELAYESFKSKQGTLRNGVLAWTHKNPETYLNEPIQVGASTYLPSVTINQKEKKWKELADEYLLTIDSKLTHPEEIKELSRRLTKNIDDIESKVSILTNYVQKNVTYKALEFGVRGRIPNTPEGILSDRYGDCKDHALLLWSLLESAGVDAKLALVNLSKPVDPQFPSLDQFNHMVTYIPKLNGGQFIDSTDKAMALIRRVPSSLGDTNALILERKTSFIKKIPQYNINDNTLSTVRNIYVKANKDTEVKESFTLSGYSESSFREYLQDIEPGKRLDWAKQFIDGLDKRVNLLSFDILNLADSRKPLQLKMNYKLVTKKLTDGTLMVDDVALWEYYYLIPKAVSNRKTDFEINYPMSFNSEVNIFYPEGYLINLKELNNREEDNKFGTLNLSSVSDKNMVSKQFRFVEKKGIYSKRDYQQYYNFAKKSMEFLSASLKISP